MDGPMHTASQVLTTKLMYGWAQTYEAPLHDGCLILLHVCVPHKWVVVGCVFFL
jgi:hypothetical protein